MNMDKSQKHVESQKQMAIEYMQYDFYEVVISVYIQSYDLLFSVADTLYKCLILTCVIYLQLYDISLCDWTVVFLIIEQQHQEQVYISVNFSTSEYRNVFFILILSS